LRLCERRDSTQEEEEEEEEEEGTKSFILALSNDSMRVRRSLLLAGFGLE
jgi:hypothetical protein